MPPRAVYRMISTWWLSLMVLVSRGSASVAEQCPGSCYCDEGGEYVSCVGDGVWQFPGAVPQTTVRLEMRNYLVDSLGPQDFGGLFELQELKLQQSRIETLENATFATNPKLQRLDLSQNMISSLSSAVFNNLSHLRYLDLSSNVIEFVEEAFANMVNLEQLNLRDNRIPQLTTRTFVGLHKVQYLNLDANNISSIEVGTFQYLTNLAHLILSNNPLTSLSRLDFFGSRLQFIDISHVGLDRVPQSLTKFVRDLRLAKNNLTHISAGDFDSYPYLGLLVLDDNCVSEIENDALGRQEYLMRLWLNGNCLTKVPPNLPPSLLALYMEENKLSDLPGYSFKGLVHLEQLFLQRNEIRMLSACVFCDLISLKSLDLQANQIENLTAGIFTNLTQLETLDLSQNNLKTIDSRCFDSLSHLKTLQMSRVPTSVSMDESMFDPLHSLQTLEVYDSSLLVHFILNSTRMLHGLRKVQELNIMHNRIVRLRADFPSFFPSLRVIKMSGNLWHCDRDIAWLANWIKQSNVQFYSSYSIRCASPQKLQFKPLMMLTESDYEAETSSTVTTSTQTETTSKIPVSSSVDPTHPSTTSLHHTEITSEEAPPSSTKAFTSAEIHKETTFASSHPYRYDLVDDHSANLSDPTTTTVGPSPSAFTTTELENSTSNSTYPTAVPTTTAFPQTESEPQTVSVQRRVLSSRLRVSSPTAEPQGWTQSTTVVLSAGLAGGCLLLVVGILTAFTVFRLRHRYQPVKHVRRSSSISYYPQKDEVSIVTLTEGTVGLKTNSHHGLGNKLYYIMENGCSTDANKDALPDPQLQELLPRSPTENGTIY